MASQGGISGTAVAAASAGGVLLYASLRGVSPLQALKDILSGRPPAVSKAPAAKVGANVPNVGATATSSQSLIPGATASSSNEIVSAALKYVGVPYKWGGATPSGFDCSGLVTYVLHHDLGYNLPSNTHTTSAVFYVWSGLLTVKASQALAGDLVCYPSHVAIYMGDGRMVEAPRPGKVVQVAKVRSGGIYRRLKTAPSYSSKGAV